MEEEKKAHRVVDQHGDRERQSMTSLTFQDGRWNIEDGTTQHLGHKGQHVTSLSQQKGIGQDGSTVQNQSQRKQHPTSLSSYESQQDDDLMQNPSQEGQRLVPFTHQVGGHHGILFYDKHTICKPAFHREVNNYQYFATVLGNFMPKFKGVTKVLIKKNTDGHVTYSVASTALSANNNPCARFKKEIQSTADIENGVGTSALEEKKAFDITGNKSSEMKNDGESRDIELELTPSEDPPSSASENSVSESEQIRGTGSSKSNKRSAEFGNDELPGIELELMIATDPPWALDEGGNRPVEKKGVELTGLCHSATRVPMENGGQADLRDGRVNAVHQDSSCDPTTCQRSKSSPNIGKPRHISSSSEDISDTVFKDAENFSFDGQETGHNPWSLRCHQATMTRHLSDHNVGDMKPAKIQTDYILLENIASNYQCPSIIDLKIGTRCYGDDLSEEKKQLNMARVADSTSSVLGVRFGGMQVYQADKGRYLCCNKKYGNTLNKEHLRKEVSRFVYQKHSLRIDILRAIVASVGKLRDHIARLEGCRFFACSLLIVYEGMDEACRGIKEGQIGGDGVKKSTHGKVGGVLNSICSGRRVQGCTQFSGIGMQDRTHCNGLEVQDSTHCDCRDVQDPIHCDDVGVQNSTLCSGMGEENCYETGMENHTHCNGIGVQDPLLRNGVCIQDSNSCNEKGNVQVKIIDFMHASSPELQSEDGVRYEGIDEGFVYGLKNVINLFQAVMLEPRN